MRTTFSRLFSVTALIVLVAVVGLGMSFRVMVKNYLAAEQQEALQAKAATVTELTADYAGFASAYGLDVSTKFHKTLSFASQFSQTDILVCDTQGQVITCSCQEFWCRHIGLYLDPDYVQEVLLHGEDSRTGILTNVYEENRYLVARVCTMSDGSVGGLVIASEPVQGTGQILSQMTQIFVFVALIVLLLTVMCFSIFTQNLCRPLKAMANAAREFGHGNLKARVETGGDYTQEIDELAVAFNNMASSLEQSEYQRQEFVANVSHELKTPMTTIGGYVDGILDGTIPPEPQPGGLGPGSLYCKNHHLQPRGGHLCHQPGRQDRIHLYPGRGKQSVIARQCLCSMMTKTRWSRNTPPFPRRRKSDSAVSMKPETSVPPRTMAVG